MSTSLVVGIANSTTPTASIQLDRFTFTEYHMGVDARITVYAPSRAQAESACAAGFEKMAELDSIMSDYQIHSELMRLCDQAGKSAVPVSPDLFRVLQESVAMSRLSNGLFDVSIGPLVRLWRRARKAGVLPQPAEVARARSLVGWRNIGLDLATHSVRLTKPGMKLDLGAIGKGYADDAVQTVLRQHGIDRALVEMGGDIVVSQAPPGEKGWVIQLPNAENDHGAPKLPFVNCAISTSGDTEEFAVIGGKRRSHVINPHTGQALTHRVQATVIARTGSISDPLSTAMTLVPAKDRKKLLAAYPGAKVYVKILQGS